MNLCHCQERHCSNAGFNPILVFMGLKKYLIASQEATKPHQLIQNSFMCHKRKKNKTKSNCYELPADRQAHTCLAFPCGQYPCSLWKQNPDKYDASRYWLNRHSERAQNEAQPGNCFDMGRVGIKPLEKLWEWFCRFGNKERQYPNRPPNERERPQPPGCFFNPFQGPERPGRSCSCVLQTSGCVNRKGISPGLTMLVPASSPDKARSCLEQKTNRGGKIMAVSGRDPMGFKKCAAAEYHLHQAIFWQHAWRQSELLNHGWPWPHWLCRRNGCYLGAIYPTCSWHLAKDETNCLSLSLSLAQQWFRPDASPKRQVSPRKGLPWKMQMVNNMPSNLKVPLLSAAPIIYLSLPAVRYLPSFSSPTYPIQHFTMIQVRPKPWAGCVGDRTTAFYTSVMPGSLLEKHWNLFLSCPH